MEWLIPDEQAGQSLLFHSQNIEFNLRDESKYHTWIESILAAEDHEYGEINFIFCDDDYLLEKNKAYLQHDTLTDIITFEYNHTPISGDIFISIERVRENALERKLLFEKELHRVMAHGILHLCGYGDKKETEVTIMREKEEVYIGLI